jgi:hypothetical protein
LLIKDNDYYISGSFNFLSFAKQEGQQVANEESHLVTFDVNKKWEKVIKEYNLQINPPIGINSTPEIKDYKKRNRNGVYYPIVPNKERTFSFDEGGNDNRNTSGENRISKQK